MKSRLSGSQKASLVENEKVRDASGHRALAIVIVEAREKRGWKQGDLAREAGVSPKTVKNVEVGNGARFDAIVRLANALGRRPQDLLRIAGGAQVSVDKIKAALRSEQSGMYERDGMAPIEYFNNVLAQLKDRKAPALMCICVTSRPATLVNSGVQAKFREMLEANLHVALVSPYPDTSRLPANYSEKHELVTFYRQVFGWLRGLGTMLSEMAPSKRNHFRAFVPRPVLMGATDAVGIPPRMALVPPPLRLVEYRPALLQFSATADGRPHRFELGTYVKYGGRRSDQWLTIFPPAAGTDEEQGQAIDALATWRDFFGNILEAWNPAVDTAPWDDTKFTDWEAIETENR